MVSLSTTLNLAILIMISQLLLFHLWLSFKGYSTFSYLNYQRMLSATKGQLREGNIDQEEFEQWVKANQGILFTNSFRGLKGKEFDTDAS